jgi:hypothetical protein
MNNYYTIKGDEPNCPITEADLVNYLRLDGSPGCQELSIFMNAATRVAISYLQRALLTQRYTYQIDGIPYIGTKLRSALSGSETTYLDEVNLPFAGLIDLVSVEVIDQDGVATTVDPDAYIVDTVAVPSRIKFVQWGAIPMDDSDKLKIVYDAGYGEDTTEVPEGIRLGLLMLAGYMYEHRGECAPATSLSKSGATLALKPYRISTGRI